MLSVIAAQNINSPAQVVQKCARRLIDGTQCLLLLLLLFSSSSSLSPFWAYKHFPAVVKIPAVSTLIPYYKIKQSINISHCVVTRCQISRKKCIKFSVGWVSSLQHSQIPRSLPVPPKNHPHSALWASLVSPLAEVCALLSAILVLYKFVFCCESFSARRS